MSATLSPAFSPERVAAGNRRSADVRSRRRELKARLKSGDALIVDVLREPEWWISRAPVHEVLSWAPGVGSLRVNRILRRADVWPLRRMGCLTLRQRERLVAAVGFVCEGACSDLEGVA